MKKLFSICLAGLLVFASVGVAAATDPMQDARFVCETNGDTVDLYFSASVTYPSDTAAFESMDFELQFNPDALTFVAFVTDDTGALESDVFYTSFLTNYNLVTDGSLKFAAASAYGVAGAGQFFHIQFRVTGEGDYGFTPTLVHYSLYDTATGVSTAYLCEDWTFDSVQANDTNAPSAVPSETDAPAESDASDNSDADSDEAAQPNWFVRLLRAIFGPSCCGSAGR